MAISQTADARGLPLSGADSGAVATFESLMTDSYYYRLGVQDRLDELLQQQPTFGMAHVFRGYSLMTDGLVASHAKATTHLKMAEASPATERERLHQTALRAWLDQDPRARGLAWEQILAYWPRDLLAFRQHTGALFWSGNKKHQAQVAASVASHWQKGTPGRSIFLSAYAFSMEEAGQYAEAEGAARTALAAESEDLWALHALTHVFEMQGRKQDGITLLSAATPFLKNYNLFRGHLWWHLAIFKFSQQAYDEVLELLDREIYPGNSSFYLDIQNAASLLLRLELQGVSVGTERWERIAQGALPAATQNTIWFTTLHHVLALVRAGRHSAAQETLAYASHADAPQAHLAGHLSEAVMAFAAGQNRNALDALLALRQEFGDLGASHVQQDIYHQIMIAAALQLNEWPRVQQLLKERRAARIQNATSLSQFAEDAARIDTFNTTAQVQAEFRM
jgi:protein-disulfide isomerase-like protein with CxxC motif